MRQVVQRLQLRTQLAEVLVGLLAARDAVALHALDALGDVLQLGLELPVDDAGTEGVRHDDDEER
jgi:hypothetical protein